MISLQNILGCDKRNTGTAEIVDDDITDVNRGMDLRLFDLFQAFEDLALRDRVGSLYTKRFDMVFHFHQRGDGPNRCGDLFLGIAFADQVQPLESTKFPASSSSTSI